jgi:hypothetical protein
MSILEGLATEKERIKKEKRETRNHKGNLETLPSAKSVALAPQSRPLLAGEIENRDRLSHWFNHGYDAIEKVGEGQWKTLPYYLLPAAIYEKWRDGDRAIGLGFGKETNYFVIDIDCGSKYHNEAAIGEIKAALEAIGINKTPLIQSSFSTGFHLFGFLSESVPTFSLACALHYCLEDAGLEIQKGQLELFPNRKIYNPDGKSIYNRHRLPLQPGSGSFLLNGDFCPFVDSIEIFLDWADGAALDNDLETLLEYSELAREAYYNTSREAQANFFKTRNHSKKAKEWNGNLETAIATGWTGYHQSNILLGQIAEHGRVFLGLGGTELNEYIYKTAIAAPGYSTYCRHQKEIYSWCERWARSAERHRYPYGTRKGGEFKRLGKGGPTNEEKKADAMTRVIECVEDFEVSGRSWPATIRDRRSLIAKLAKCSERTLAKAEYLPLWHPVHLTTIDTDLRIETTRDHTPAINCVMPSVLAPVSVCQSSFSEDDVCLSTIQSLEQLRINFIQGSEQEQNTNQLDQELVVISNSESNQEKELINFSISSLIVLSPGAILTKKNAEILDMTAIQSTKSKKLSKIVPKTRQMNYFKVGDRVVSEDRPAPILSIVSFHCGNHEWPRVQADFWEKSELAHVSELRKVEDLEYG